MYVFQILGGECRISAKFDVQVYWEIAGEVQIFRELVAEKQLIA